MVLWVLFRVPTTTHFAVRFSGVRSWIFKGSDLRSYREMILNVCAGMCTIRDGCLGVDTGQTDTGADPELWGRGVGILGGFEF